MYRLVVVIAIFLFSLIDAYPNGAPISTCSTMEPHHKSQSQKNASPYALDVNFTALHTWANTETNEIEQPVLQLWSPTNAIAVTLSSTPNSRSFKGFLIEARSGSLPVGTFTLPSTSHAKVLDCPDNGQVGL